MENAGVNCMGHQTKIILRKSSSYVELENAGADFMAYMTRSGKCESTSHGLHQYTNKKSPQKGRGYGQVTHNNNN